MEKQLKKELEKKIDKNVISNSNDAWIFALLTLMMLTPTKQEPTVININLGSDK